MKTLLNEIDYNRFIALANLIWDQRSEKSEMSIYLSDNYVNLSVTAYNLDKIKIREILERLK